MRKIIEYRAIAGMTQAELAKKIGVQRITIINWEKDSTKKIDRKHAEKLCKIFSCSMIDLYGDDGCVNLIDFKPKDRKEANRFVRNVIKMWLKEYPKC